MTNKFETRGDGFSEGRAPSVAETPASAAQAGVPPTPGGNIIVGDPRKDVAAYEQFVETVRSLFYRSGEVCVMYYYGTGLVDFVAIRVVMPRYQRDGSYAVIMDEDGVPLYVLDFSAMTWSEEVAGALLDFAPEEVVRVVVEG